LGDELNRPIDDSFGKQEGGQGSVKMKKMINEYGGRESLKGIR